MAVYTPNAWVILRLTIDGEVTDKVLGGWYGGYLYGDSWRLNSGITEVRDQDGFYEFVGYSGSVYRCDKQSERMSALMAQVVAGFRASATEDGNMSVEVIEVADLRVDGSSV